MPLLILVAEDDPGIRLAVSDYLEMSGYSVITAENGQQALSLLETYHPHLLISDIIMPEKNGYELVKQVRQIPQFRLLPVIFLTEKGSKEERIRGYQAGCDLYLPKPFEIDELGAVIRNFLERSQIIQSELRFSQIEQQTQQIKSIDTNKNSSKTSSQQQQHSWEFTIREREVLNLIMVGLSNIDIGNKLHLSPRTVEKYVSNLLRKTETNNRAELVHFVFRHKLVQ